jgi:hypothetical protein
MFLWLLVTCAAAEVLKIFASAWGSLRADREHPDGFCLPELGDWYAQKSDALEVEFPVLKLC